MERRISIFFPLALIAAGMLWIMVQIKLIQPSNLWALVYLWPFLLIAAGLGLIFRTYWKYFTLVTDVLVVGGAFLAVFFAAQLGWAHAPSYMLNGSGYFVGPGERGSGKVITETREARDFTRIHLSYPAQLTITQGANESLTITGDDNLVAGIRTQVADGVLEINFLEGHKLNITPSKPTKINVVVKDLIELTFDSAGEIQVEGLKTNFLKMTMDGAGALKLNEVQLKNLECNLNGVGSIEANGSADNVNITMQGLGNFNGDNLHIQTATINLDGMGSASVWADKTLKADVSGLGSVNYYGDAEVSKTVEGLGSINFKGKK